MGNSAERNPETLAPGCVRLLEEAGFAYDRRIGAWLNVPAGRVIAFDRVANHGPEWLAAWLGLSRFHPLFIANGHDVRTVRSGSPALVLVSDDHTPASRPPRVGRRRPRVEPRTNLFGLPCAPSSGRLPIMKPPKRSRPRTARGVAILAIAVLIGVAGCVGPSPVVRRDDAAITQDVQARLAADGQTKPFAITVGTTEGVVHVSGVVTKSADRDSVERIARETPGVRSVDNNVRFHNAPGPDGTGTGTP